MQLLEGEEKNKNSFLVQTQDTLLSMLDGIVKFIFLIYWHFIQFYMFKLTVNVLESLDSHTISLECSEALCRYK